MKEKMTFNVQENLNKINNGLFIRSIEGQKTLQ